MTARLQIVAEGLRFPEGPVALPDGRILVVEIEGQALTAVSPDGKLEVIADLDGGPNGAAVGPDGWVYVCNSGGWLYTNETLGTGTIRRNTAQSPRRGWIERVRLADGAVERLHEAYQGAPLGSPNDIVFDDHGGYYFTDHGKRSATALEYGSVYYSPPDGSGLIRCAHPMITPNGLGLSRDGKTLYVAETVTRRLWAFDLVEPGRIVPEPWPSSNGGRLVAGLTDNNLLDSLALDSQGHICVACLFNGGIWVISPDGVERRHTALPDLMTTNICFGGEGLRSAYVTLSSTGRLGRLDWDQAGQPLPFLNYQP
ncbi:MAG: SMP-30/gluconolactonase/LRE family protein [Sterolibacterium sp.]|jgi:gluconolactonase